MRIGKADVGREDLYLPGAREYPPGLEHTEGVGFSQGEY
jgi:hypothetical protein